MNKRVVVTGMSVNTPLGDNLDGFLVDLLAGKSAISKWSSIPVENIYSKIGGDLGAYDIQAKLASLADKIPEETYMRLKALTKRVPFFLSLSMFVAIDAWLDSGLFTAFKQSNDAHSNRHKMATIVAGHNLNHDYVFKNHEVFNDEPDFIDNLVTLYGLDTTHVGCVSEVLQLTGPAYKVGAACASGNVALRSAVDEIRHHDINVATVVAPALQLSPLDLQGMALIGAISIRSFNDTPEKASRPYDLKREGFVPTHGAAVLIVEELEHALARGATIYAEILGVSSSGDGNHLPQPSQRGQAQLIRQLLQECHIHPQQVDYINAHATSTPLGDLTELRAIKDVFGKHADTLKLNAPKSILGHTCWSAATVETVAAILQMNKGVLHPSINIDHLDPEVDIDVCQHEAVKHDITIFLKNSFGFGGLNSVSLIKRFEA